MKIESLSRKSTKTSTNQNKFVGGYIPPALLGILNLYSLVHKKSKNAIIKDTLVERFKSIKQVDLEMELIKQLNAEWRKKEKESNVTFGEFKSAMHTQLIGMHIDTKSVTNIIQGIKEQ